MVRQKENKRGSIHVRKRGKEGEETKRKHRKTGKKSR